MTATISETYRVAFKPYQQRIVRLGIIGEGEVVQKKIWPALRSKDCKLDRIVVCSQEPASVLKGLPHSYHPVDRGKPQSAPPRLGLRVVRAGVQ